MTEQPTESPITRPAAGGVGAQLRAARLKQGRTIEDVASELHMHVKQIDALEAERFDQFPSVAFVKGYVRSYARVLGMEPEPLVEAVDRAGIDEPQWTTHAPLESARPNRWLVGAGTVVVVALVAGLSLTWLIGSGAWDQLRRHDEAEAGSKTERAAMSAGIPLAPRSTTEGNGGSSGSASPATEPTSQVAPQPAALADSVNPGAHPAGASASQTPVMASREAAAGDARANGAGGAQAPGTAPPAGDAAAPQGTDRVRITLTEDCWVEIYDSARNKVMYGLYRAGETKEATGTAPFQVFLGFAPGVKLDYNGKPFDVAQYTKSSQTARFALVNE